MARNQVAPERPFKKSRDNFFKKSKPEFKSKNKFNKQNKPKYSKVQKFNNEETFKKPNQYNKNLVHEESIKPSESGCNDFFVKPEEKSKLVTAKEKFNKDKKSGIKPSKTVEEKPDKKPFDKKAWRLKKYSNKYKLQQWEEKRKKSVLRGYYRNLKEDEHKLDVKKIYEQHQSDEEDEEDKIAEENENNLNTNVFQEQAILTIEPTVTEPEIQPKNSKERKNKAFKKAHVELERIKEEKNREKEEKLRIKAEKEEALQKYKKKKSENFKRLNKKTKKGQPIMKDRMEMLLERIQKSISN